MELAASAGLVLDPWQCDVLTHALGVRADGKWSAFEVAVIVGRQNGKGALLEAIELAGLFLFDEQLILHSAHEFKTAAEAFRRVLALVDGSDDLRRRVARVRTSHGEEGIELRTGGRLRFVARSTGSGRGFTGDRIILDEAYELPASAVEALLPTMSARPNPQLVYTSTPPLDAVSPGSETLLALHRRGLAAEEGLAYFDWGLPEGIDLDDPQNWRQANPAYGIRISDEFIRRERAAMTPAGFGRERLGIWPRAAHSAVIDPDTWTALADEDSQPGELVAFAVDVTPSRDYAAIALCGVRSDGYEHLELVDHNPGTDWVVPRLAELIERWRPVAIGLDVAGPGGSLLLDCERAGITRPEGSEPQWSQLAVPTAREAASACGSLVDAVRQGTVRHIDQAPLNVAIAGARTRPLGDAWAWARRSANVDISPLVAVTLARWAFASRVDAVARDDDYDVLGSVR